MVTERYDDDGDDGYVTRWDIGTLQKPVETDEGFLKITGYASRVGVFQYMNPDGTMRRELRLPEEVFKPDSLASYEGKPMTARHPGGPVTSKNAKKFGVGMVLQPAVQDGDHVAFKGVLTDGAAIAALRSKKLPELSSGYRLRVEKTSGVHPVYGAYDAIQRDIHINHLALVEHGRAGPTAKVNMDSFHVDSDGETFEDPGMAVMVDAELAAPERNKLAEKSFAVPSTKALPIQNAGHVRAAMARFGQTTFGSGEKRAAFNRIVARAKEFGIDPAGFVKAWGNRLDKGDQMADVKKPESKKPDPKGDDPQVIDINIARDELAREKSRADSAEKDRDAHKKRADTAEGEVRTLSKQVKDLTDAQVDQEALDEKDAKIEALELELATEKTRADAAEDPAVRKASVKSRVNLEKVAMVVLDRANFDDVDDRDLMVEVITKRGGEVKTDDSDEHVLGQFTALVKSFTRGEAALARLRKITAPVNQDGVRAQQKSARDEYIDNRQNAWKRPPGATAGKEG